MKTTVHIIPHAHWDREWYLPLEIHRARLLRHLDSVLELLETDPTYTYHLDGQMIAVEDYLMFRPEREEQIRKFVAEDRLHIGPWYVLQDEFLTSGEANVRNLLYGMDMANRFGDVCQIGYLPDAFGNVGQMPQLFVQSGMKAAAFGRGVTLRSEDADPAGHFPRYSEFNWQSPDGSVIPAIFFSGWYNNAQEIPVDPEKAKDYWDKRLVFACQYASSRHLLFLNGGDHQPVQKDLPDALETAQKLYPEIDFIYSDFKKYAECVRKDRKTAAEVIMGELAGQESDGTNTLCNTASSHIPIKILNRRNESLLSMTAEPLLSMAALAGMKIDNTLLHRAWKLLIQNHPHDSICSCGIDQVNREVVSRFEKSIQLGEYLTGQAGTYLAEKIKAEGLSDSEAAFAVFNPSGWPESQVVSVTLGVDREYGTRNARKAVLKKAKKSYRLFDSSGAEIPADFEDMDVQFGYELPNDTFRKPFFERRIRVTFSAADIPAFGYAVFYLRNSDAILPCRRSVPDPHRMENRFLSVAIHQNGTFDVTEKSTGRTYCGLGVYEDVGDVGDEYMFRQTEGETIRSDNVEAEINCIRDMENETVIQIRQKLSLPLCAAPELSEAYQAMTRKLQRNIGRSSEMSVLLINTILTLEKDSPVLRISIKFENTVKDHRLRMLFPTDINTDTHLADSVFDVIERPDNPGENWTNPSRCQRMQFFAAAEDEKGGLAVINRGLYEYEILPERKQIAVTLLRSVGEMGDWGVFLTPDAQCPGPIKTELAVYPYPGRSFRENGCHEAIRFQTDLSVFQIRNGEGTLPERYSFLNCIGKGLAVTALKPSEDVKAIVLRVCNVTDEATELDVTVPNGCAICTSNITEQIGEQISADGTGHVRIPASKKEIKTLRIEMDRYE